MIQHRWSILLLVPLAWSCIRSGGTWIDPYDPLYQDAVCQARESIHILRDLAVDYPSDIKVKFRFITDLGSPELVWGQLRAITDSAMRVSIESVPLAQSGKLPDEIEIPLDELLDWHLELKDGTIRGSFTTQAEIVLRELQGLAPLRQTTSMKEKFVDRLQPGCLAARRSRAIAAIAQHAPPAVG